MVYTVGHIDCEPIREPLRSAKNAELKKRYTYGLSKVLLNYAEKERPLHMTTLYGSGKWLLVRTTGRSCMSQQNIRRSTEAVITAWP